MRTGLTTEGGKIMARWKPDPTFYPSPKPAIQAPEEELAYVAMLLLTPLI